MSSEWGEGRPEGVGPEGLGAAAGAVRQIAQGLDALLGLDLDVVSAREMGRLVAAVEVQARRLDAARLQHVGAIDRRSLNLVDGHFSARTMIRHVAKLSGAEAARRTRNAAMVRDLPLFREAYEAGEVPTCNLSRLGRVHVNPRVKEKLAQCEELLLAQAKRCSARDFDVLVTYWERLADEDGTIAAAERAHRRRDLRLTQDPLTGSWKIAGNLGSLDGAVVAEILEHFVQAERLTDWEKARAEHGDDATEADLPRTDAQRRADAFVHIFQRAASTPPGGSGPEVTVDVVMDQATFERQLQRMGGGHPPEPDPCDPSHRCSTLNGRLVDPLEAAVAAFVHSVRRVVVDGKGTVIDLGPRRFFTGNARLAVLLASTTCVWPGCGSPVTACQADHLRPHSHGGRTHPANGAPLCGRHNRHKHRGGFRTWRDESGQWHTLRPDGTEI